MSRPIGLWFLLCQSYPVLSYSPPGTCKQPLGAPSYTPQKMKGFWYEIARMQTAGGAAFQIGSVCTGFDFTPFGDGAR